MLVIEWDRDRLIIVSGEASGSSVRLRAATTVDRIAGQTPEELGSQLRASLTASGISEESATVVLPRELVTLRRLTLPNVNDDELPDLVRLQAATRLTVPVESVALDFVPLPDFESEGREVLLVTAPGQHIAALRTTIVTAGLELSGVRVSSFGIAQSLAHAGRINSAVGGRNVAAIICMRSDTIEFLVMKNDSLVFSHSGAGWDSPDRIEQALRQEISRGRLAATEDIGPHKVAQLTLIGHQDVTAAVPDSVTQRLDSAPITRIDPASSLIQDADRKLPDDLTASQLLATVGVIAGSKRGLISAVDLVNPRRPPEKVDNTRMKIILAVGLGALLLVGGWKWRDSQIQDLERQTSALEKETGSLEKKYKDSSADLAQDEAIQEWTLGDINWIDEMVKIREVMGSTEQLLIRNIDFLTSQNQQYRGKITAECFAKSRRDVEDFMRRLEAAGYDVAPPQYQAGSREPDYPTQVPLELNLPLPEEES